MVSFAGAVLIALCLSTLAIAPKTQPGAESLAPLADANQAEPEKLRYIPINESNEAEIRKKFVAAIARANAQQKERSLAMSLESVRNLIQESLFDSECSVVAPVPFLLIAAVRVSVADLMVDAVKNRFFLCLTMEDNPEGQCLTVTCPYETISEFRRAWTEMPSSVDYAAHWKRMLNSIEFHFDTKRIVLWVYFDGNEQFLVVYEAVMAISREDLQLPKFVNYRKIKFESLDVEGDKFRRIVKGKKPLEFSVPEIIRGKAKETRSYWGGFLITAIDMAIAAEELAKKPSKNPTMEILYSGGDEERAEGPGIPPAMRQSLSVASLIVPHPLMGEKQMDLRSIEGKPSPEGLPVSPPRMIRRLKSLSSADFRGERPTRSSPVASPVRPHSLMAEQPMDLPAKKGMPSPEGSPPRLIPKKSKKD